MPQKAIDLLHAIKSKYGGMPEATSLFQDHLKTHPHYWGELRKYHNILFDGISGVATHNVEIDYASKILDFLLNL